MRTKTLTAGEEFAHDGMGRFGPVWADWIQIMKSFKPWMKPMLLTSSLIIGGSANAAALRCASVFVASATAGQALAPREAKESSRLAQAQRDALLIQMKEQLDFSLLDLPGQVQYAIPSRDGSLFAVTSQVPRRPGEAASTVLKVVDVKNQKVVFSDTFAVVNKLEFIDQNNRLGVAGTRAGDGQKSRLYILHLREDKDSQKRPALPINTSTSSQALTPFSMFSSAFWGVATTAQNRPAPSPQKTVQDLPASKDWGVGVTQMISREDLPQIVVVQNSENPIATIRYRAVDLPGVDPKTTVVNYNVTLIDPHTLLPTAHLKYGDLSPMHARLNPRSTLMALTLKNPVVAMKSMDAVVVVDAARDPEKPLYTYQLGGSGFTVPMSATSHQVVGHQIGTHWSPDGRFLLITEAAMGTVVVYDTVSQTELVSKRELHSRWPIAGARLLADGRLLILRLGSSPQGGAFQADPSVKAFVIDLHESATQITARLNDDGGSDYDVELSQRRDLLRLGDTGVSQVRKIFEMKNGRVIVLVLRDQLILIDRDHPENQRVVVPDKVAQRSEALLSSVIQISDDLLQVSDHEHGVYTFEIGL